MDIYDVAGALASLHYAQEQLATYSDSHPDDVEAKRLLSDVLSDMSALEKAADEKETPSAVDTYSIMNAMANAASSAGVPVQPEPASDTHQYQESYYFDVLPGGLPYMLPERRLTPVAGEDELGQVGQVVTWVSRAIRWSWPIAKGVTKKYGALAASALKSKSEKLWSRTASVAHDALPAAAKAGGVGVATAVKSTSTLAPASIAARWALIGSAILWGPEWARKALTSIGSGVGAAGAGLGKALLWIALGYGALKLLEKGR